MPQRQGGLFLVLGGAPSVWTDYAEARAMVGPDAGVIACNHAAVGHKGPLHAFATLHPEMAEGFLSARGGPRDFPVFAPARHTNCPDAIVVEPRWVGSSGMYALEIGATQLQASGLILCGMPMDAEAGHIDRPGPWNGGNGYRKAFADALPAIGGRVRSMGGWTRDLFGAPTSAWLQALSGAKPFARPNHRPQTRPPMHTVTNISDTAQRVVHHDPVEGLTSTLLAPGESADLDVDPAQARFQPGGRLTAVPAGTKAGAAAKPKASTPKVKAAVKPKPPAAPKAPVETAPEPEDSAPEAPPEA